MMTGWPAFMHECVIVPYHHCLTIFWQEQRFSSWKTVKNAILQVFLRHFTTIYGIEMGAKHDSMFWNSDVCVYQVQFPIFWQFSSYFLYIYARKTKKMVKNAILTAFYGMKWYWIITGWPEFMRVYLLVPDYHCLTIFLP